MDRSTQVALMHRIFGFLDARTTELGEAPYVNPVASYTSPAQLARERELLFGRQPLFVGLSGDLPAPGAYLVREDSGVPILVVRADSGALRAFLGLCRHRGAPVASGAGQSNGRFVCPYHAWAYDDAGQLVAQP
ncbi:MAG: aromatic ring-hydroxylating oxygenase subunit alpha, partial [Candidatus Binatia bacterium]